MTDPQRHVVDLLSAHLDHSLSDMEAIEVEAHLKVCQDCEQQYQDLLHMKKALRDQPAMTPPESFYQAVHERIKEKPARGAWLTGMPVKLLASACLVLLGVWGGRQTIWKEQPVAPVRTAAPLAKPVPTVPVREEAPKEADSKPAPGSAMEIAEAKSQQALKEYEGVAADAERPAAPKLQPVMALAKKKSVAMSAGNMSAAFSASGSAPAAAAAPIAKALPPPVQQTVINVPTPTDVKPGLDVSLPSRSDQLAPKLILEWRGTHSGLKKFKTYVIRTEDEWRSLWEKHASGATAPAVDFSQAMVVGIITGTTHTHGQGLEIMGTRTTSEAFVIYYRDAVDVFRNTPSASAYTPYHFKVIPKTSLPVEFQKI